MSKTFQKREARTVLDIWAPRYSSAHTEAGEPVALLACYKVQQAAPWIIIEFSRRPHLAGLRYCISREEAMRCPIEDNGKIPCFVVKMSQLQWWDTAEEIYETVERIFPN